MLFNYVVGNTLSDQYNTKSFGFSKKSILTFGIISNLSLLGYFKYSDFFIGNLNIVLSTHIGLLNLALPLAISFFTFQQISYLVDSYRKETKEYDFLSYALFVTFFPQLIAGPIVHHKEMMPQFAQAKSKIINYKNISLGVFIFSIGMFKKVVIADTFATWATQGFDVATSLNLIEAWVTSLSYTFQLYFDFSGYTDMALGAALLFNIKLPINFNSPYKAINIQDFWRRWHITLSRFLKDYIYIPLGGNRKGEFKTYNNLFATFLIGGIWHGAGWTFIMWGALHGLAIAIHRAWQNLGFTMQSWLGWLITFNFVNIAWVFFRAKDWGSAIKVLSSMFSLNIILPQEIESKMAFLSDYDLKFGNFLWSVSGDHWTIIWLLLGFFLTLVCRNSIEKLNSFKPNLLNTFFTSLLLFYISISMGVESEFLYFNF